MDAASRIRYLESQVSEQAATIRTLEAECERLAGAMFNNCTMGTTPPDIERDPEFIAGCRAIDAMLQAAAPYYECDDPITVWGRMPVGD